MTVSGSKRDSSAFSKDASPKPEAKRIFNEEGIERYRQGGFHPVRIGETYNFKYEVVRKLGYGMFSTVWLVQEKKRPKARPGLIAQNSSLFARFAPLPEVSNDETEHDDNTPEDQGPSYWAMKVLSAECYGAGKDINELEVLQHLADGDKTHGGYKYITTMQESFTHVGPNGQHVCLIMKVMAEDLSSFRSWFPNRLVPPILVQRFTCQLLKALDYAHSREVIHTDIQPGNIMIQLPDPKLIPAFLEKTANTAATKSSSHSETYSIIPSQSLKGFYFVDPDFDMTKLDIALADWGIATWSSDHYTEKIQPILLRAPEVLPEAPWDASADVFNLGCLMPELVMGHTLFSGRNSGGNYSVGKHLKEMDYLLGPLPDHVKAEGNKDIVESVFDDDGEFHDKRVMTGEKLEGKFPELGEEDLDKFVAFVKRICTLDKDFRPSAKELLDDEWLQHDYTAEQMT